MTVTGTTRVLGLLGTPIVQVQMPGIMNRSCEEHGLDFVLFPVDVGADGVAPLMQAAKAWHNLNGLIVTVPYKQVVARLCDKLTDRAARLSTANIVRRDADGTLVGDILDGVGFVEAARANGFAPEGKRAGVIGAGGVASAIANSLCESGVSELRIQDIDTAKQAGLAATLRGAFPAIRVLEGIGDVSSLDLLANGTPVGMNGDPSLPLPDAVLAGLGKATYVADVVTKPLMTPFLTLAQSRGCRIQNGVEMTRPQLMPMARFLGVVA